MNKFKAWHLALICLAVFLIFAGISAIVVAANPEYRTANSWTIGPNFRFFGFGSGKEYTIDKTETVDIMNKSKVAISGVSSDITITQSQGDKLSAHLYGEYKSRNGEIKLEILNNGSTSKINIKYPKSGVTYSSLTLDITIPKGYDNDLTVNSVSSDILFECEDMMFEDVNTNNVSGTTNINTLRAQSLEVDTVSGGVKGELLEGSLDVNGVSASVNVTGLSDKVKIGTVSGRVILQFKELTQEVKVDTTSGRIEFTIPEDSEFYVHFDSVSGNFKCDMPVNIVRQKGGDFEGYVGSENSTNIDIDSVSGNFKILN